MRQPSGPTSHPIVDELRASADTPLPPGPRVLTDAEVDAQHRARLMAAMAETLAEKGLAATTVADVVGRAQVSRRTFYGHFADKEACFLATYDACADILLARVAQAVDGTAHRPYGERITLGVHAYLDSLAGEPALARVFLYDILAAGPEALRHRNAVNERFADLIRALVEQHRDELPPGYAMHPDMAHALVGAVEELVLLAISEDRAEDLPRLADTATRLIHAALVAGD